ncbi:MAG: N-acetylmuramidase domain-containing protein [Hyphomicrobiales bacterium]|nr:N-acetylmuramidase domain-containing protein [Hyphomicrobiales bacterium]
MFSNDVISEIRAAAKSLGIEPAALLAVAEVESGGAAFAVVDGKREPLIRFEGHYFDRLLSPEKQAVARAAGLSSPIAGAIANPVSQAGRWDLLARAVRIDRPAAYESVSWGIGQVMGAHWQKLGFASVGDFVALARRDVAGQTEIMARFIDREGLSAALAAQDWPAFARGYNGPLYVRSNYDGRIAAAYAEYGGKGPGGVPPKPEPKRGELLYRGARGPTVYDLQTVLTSLGYGTAADGIFGRNTERAVKAFQRGYRLAADGIVGPATYAAIEAAMGGTSGLLALFRRAWISLLARIGLA